MVRKNFRINIILRLLLICLLLAAFFYFLLVSINYIRSAYLFILICFIVWELFYYIDRVNRDLATFFIALLQNDFSTSFAEVKRGKSFRQLYSTMQKITQKFREVGTQKEQQLIFLEMLVEHVKAGIVSFDRNEKIHLMNQSLQKLLKRPKFHYLKSFHNIDPELISTMREIKSGEHKLLKIKAEDQLLHLSIHASEFYIGEEYFKLLSLQDIKTELEVNEVETWQKLIRVLTHEIMNSVSPITSLTDTMLMMLKKNDLGPDITKDIISGLEAVKIRSSGLQKFTEAYRKLTKIPKPHFQKVSILEFLERVVQLVKPSLEENKIELDVACDSNIIAYIDPDLIAQVLINIIKNSIEAFEDQQHKMIIMEVKKTDAVEIVISDNGPGIPEEVADQIFVPFFTTKASGSGIGLALSRQIMHLHKGSLNMESHHGSSFILKF